MSRPASGVSELSLPTNKQHMFYLLMWMRIKVANGEDNTATPFRSRLSCTKQVTLRLPE